MISEEFLQSKLWNSSTTSFQIWMKSGLSQLITRNTYKKIRKSVPSPIRIAVLSLVFRQSSDKRLSSAKWGLHRAKLVKPSLNIKLDICSNDPRVKDALLSLTAFAGDLAKEESTVSLSYSCCQSESIGVFLVSQKDHPLKSRTVTIWNDAFEEAVCSCCKKVLHGIVSRNIF